MARKRRLKYHGDNVYYHIISRTVGQEFLLNEKEKDHLMNLFYNFSSLYFVKMIGYCIMDNHFHLIVKSENWRDYSEEDINSRLKVITEGKKITEVRKAQLLDQYSDISEYMKSIKQTFSRWYNKRKARSGYFWSDRFKSVILEQRNALKVSVAYVDLNPVRAGIVDKPENYRWSSIHVRSIKSSRAKHLHFTGIFNETEMTEEEMLLIYRRFLYAVGAVEVDNKFSIPQHVIAKEKALGFEMSSVEVITGRIRHFTEGCVIGSKDFIEWAYGHFGNRGIYKNDRKIYDTDISNNIHSIQRLIAT